jgi:uncharacterized membrane protein
MDDERVGKGLIILPALIAGLLIYVSAFGAEYIYKPIKMPEAQHTQPHGINDLGDVVGVYADCEFCDVLPFLFSDGQYFELGVAGARRVMPFGINKHGVIAGSLVNGDQHAFIMDEAQTTILDGAVRADAINNNPDSVVVGYRSTQKFNQAAYLWRAGNYMALINPDQPGVIASAATGINDRGDVVGYWATDVDGVNVKVQGFVIKKGKLTFIDDLLPLGINDDGVIVGMSGAGNDGAVLENGVVTLIKYPGAAFTQAYGINKEGTIVGYYIEAGQQRGFTATPVAAVVNKGKKKAAELLAQGKK